MPATLAPIENSELRSPFAVRWTRADCEKLEADGYLNYRYELVEGEIIRKMAQKIAHRLATNALVFWLISLFGRNFVQNQATIDVSPEDNPTSQPEPDGVVTSVNLQELLQIEQVNPTAGQVRLVVEISDTTLRYDLTVKAGLYARANIPEYWVLNLIDRRLHILRDPQNGTYQDIQEYAENVTVTCLAAPQTPVLVSALLP